MYIIVNHRRLCKSLPVSIRVGETGHDGHVHSSAIGQVGHDEPEGYALRSTVDVGITSSVSAATTIRKTKVI